MKKLITASVFAALTLATQSARAGDPGPDWDFLIDQQNGTHVHFGVNIGGPFPYTRNAEDVVPPASLTKLFTTGAALEKLGAEFRFETRIEWRNPFPRDEDKISDLTIIGSGDPSWSEIQFEQIAQLLKDQKVREIHGGIHLVAADPRWEKDDAPVGWLAQDLAQCDGAQPQAFNIELNCAVLVINGPTHSHWQQGGINTPVQVNLDWGTETFVSAQRDGSGFKVFGTWADGTKELRLQLPVPNTMSWAEHAFEQAIQAQGIRILPRSRPTSGSFALANHSASLFSPPLRELLKPLLKKNINLIAESLFVAMGGQDALRDYLNTHLPEEKTISLWDGSGLSRSNTASANGLMTLLSVLAKSADFHFVWDALSVAGVDGSLGKRMRGTEAEGILRGKSGWLKGYYHIAGYIPRYDGAGNPSEFIPFVMLSQAKPGDRKVARASEDRVGVQIVRSAF